MPCQNAAGMRRAAALVALALVPARTAAAAVLEDWPCPGCVTVTPPSDGGTPVDAREPGSAAEPPAPFPLLVALHGDGGGVRQLVRAWKQAAADAGVLLLAPRCPQELGCPAGSFWRWYASAGHEPSWLGAQIDAVAARFPVDSRRLYATGYSGGATYLGWYAPTHATRFAAVAHVAGGAAYRPPCPTCKLPVLFVLGASDPMLGPYTRPLRDWYEACGGHEISWETLPGVTHEGILRVLEEGRARRILAWLLDRPAACEDGVPVDASAVSPVVESTEAGPPPLHDREEEKKRELRPALPQGTRAEPPPRVPPGCACSVGETSSVSGGLTMASLLAALVGRRLGRAGWRVSPYRDRCRRAR